MRELTFKGYLQQQLCELSDCDSKSLYQFSRLAEHNARLRDVLTLYLRFYVPDKLKSQLMKRFSYLKMTDERLSAESPEQLAQSGSEYRTIYNNYLNQKNANKSDNKLKEMMWERIVEIQTEKGITNYRIYKSLKLNPGNINAFLKNRDVSKVGVYIVRRILEFVNGYNADTARNI